MFERMRAHFPHSRTQATNVARWATSKLWMLWISRDFAALGTGANLIRPCWIFGAENISIGDHVQIGPMCRIGALWGTPITIGDRCEITGGSSLFAQTDGIEIGASVLLAWNVQIFDSHHKTSDPTRPIREQGMTRGGKVVIRDGAWLGANVVVLAGVTIGRNAVIGANSVVTRDVPDFGVVAGAPARPIRSTGD